MLHRRRLIQHAVTLAGMSCLPRVGLSANPATYEGPVIDFRVRPPYKSFRRALYRGLDAATTDEELMEAFCQAMDEQQIETAVLMGRGLPESGFMGASIPNREIFELRQLYPGRFEAFGSVNVRNPGQALKEIQWCHDHDFRGIAFDNPLSDPPLYDDDVSLFPIYEQCARLGLMISLTSSILVGPSISYSSPQHIQAVATAFPKTPVLVPHASWPWIRQLIAVALQGKMMGLSRVYLIPDFYFSQDHAPGRDDILDAARFGLDDRILFASSVPALDMRAAVAHTRNAYELSPQIRGNILYHNAAALLAGSV